MMKDGLTLAHPDKEVRDYWDRTWETRARKIAEYMGKEIGQTCIDNFGCLME